MTTFVQAYRLLIADVYELAGTSRRTSERMAGTHGQTAARWHVLSVVSEVPASVAGAARRLGLARQSVQRVVNELRAEELVTVSVDPRDRRAPLVRLTDQGRQVLDALFEQSEADRAARVASTSLSVADLLQARETLRALAAALTDPGHGVRAG